MRAELPVAEVEKVFKRWAQVVEDHCVIVASSAKPPNEGYADTASQRLVGLWTHTPDEDA